MESGIQDRKPAITLLVLLIPVLSAAPSRATTLVRLSLEQLSQASTHIVRGHVVSQESRWNDAHTQIVTLTTVAVDKVVKGQPPSILLIEQPGGAVGNIHSHVPGTVHFVPQADYLLFLEPAQADPPKYLVVGMMQGSYRIYRDASTQEERIIMSVGGFFRRREDAAPDQTMALSQFRQQLNAALSAPMVIPKGTSISLTIESTEFRGVGRYYVRGRTTQDVFPSSKVVIPAGSSIKGTAQLVSGVWRIRWTEVSVRGSAIEIQATSEEPRGESLRGRSVVANVR